MSAALAGRTAIVTGASSGIGLGIARRLIAHGAAVFAATRTKEDLEKVLEEVDIAGGFVGELQQAGVADDLVNTAIGTLGHIDILVNNAGGGVIRPTLNTPRRRCGPPSTTTCGQRSLRASGAAAHGGSRARPHHQHRRRLGANRAGGSRDVQRRKGWCACDGHRAGTRVRQGRHHGEHRGAVLHPTPELAALFESGQAPARLLASSSRARPSCRSAAQAIQRRSRRPSPSWPARTADSSPGKRFSQRWQQHGLMPLPHNPKDPTS